MIKLNFQNLFKIKLDRELHFMSLIPSKKKKEILQEVFQIVRGVFSFFFLVFWNCKFPLSLPEFFLFWVKFRLSVLNMLKWYFQSKRQKKKTPCDFRSLYFKTNYFGVQYNLLLLVCNMSFICCFFLASAQSVTYSGQRIPDLSQHLQVW